MSSNVIRYSNDGKSLQYVPAIQTIVIKAAATSIKGSRDVNAFYNAANTIETVEFEPKSKMGSISSYCFYGCSKLREIDLSVCTELVSIGDYAFYSCTSLKTLKLPESLSMIGNWSFARSGLVSIEIPKSVSSIGQRGFSYCYSLTTYTIPDDSLLTVHGGCMFTNDNLTSWRITKNIEQILASDFEYCKNIFTITKDPRNTRFTVEDNTIYNKDKTAIIYSASRREKIEFTIPESVETLYTCAFHSSSLQIINFPQNLKNISSWVFLCSKITQLSLPGTCKIIGGHSFSRCEGLTSITLPEGLESIGDLCFSECNNLKAVNLPSSLNSIGGMCFPLTAQLNFPSNSNIYIDEQKLIINRKKTILYQCFGEVESVELPHTVAVIKAQAFYNLSTLRTVTIPDNSLLNKIDHDAFRYSGITNIKLPAGLKVIMRYAFFKCANLKGLEFGSLLCSIGYYAFDSCTSLTKVVFAAGDSDLEIEYNAFYNCSNIESVEFNGRIKTIGEFCFYQCEKIASIVLPAKLISIGISAFYGCGITSLTIDPKSQIEVIDNRVFCHCHKLSQVSIPETITEIRDQAFSYTALEKITFPNGVKTIGEMCFNGCSRLTDVYIKEGSNLKDICFGAFDQCLSFKAIHNNCTNFVVENEALFNSDRTELIILPPNSSIKYFSFPPTLKIIRITALQCCKNLNVIFLPNSVTTIMEYAFSECSNLRSINIPKECVTIKANAFSGCFKLQCGISVENETEEFRQNLIDVAKMPRKAIFDCNVLCTLNCRNNVRLTSSLLLVLCVLNC